MKELKKVKNNLDKAYQKTLEKHDENQAYVGIYGYLINGFSGSISTFQLRKTLNNYTEYMIKDVIIDYAVSSFMYHNLEIDINPSIAYDYYNDIDNYELDYSNQDLLIKVIIEGILLKGVIWVLDLLAYNLRFKNKIVESLVDERYTQNKASELDSVFPSRTIIINGEKLNLDKNEVLSDLENIIKDEIVLRKDIKKCA